MLRGEHMTGLIKRNGEIYNAIYKGIGLKNYGYAYYKS